MIIDERGAGLLDIMGSPKLVRHGPGFGFERVRQFSIDENGAAFLLSRPIPNLDEKL